MYIGISSAVTAILYVIFLVAAAGVPKVEDFCSHCGRNIKNEGAGGVCKSCGQRKYIPGFLPIPRDVVAAYPYSGETLVGMSQKYKVHISGVILLTVLIGGISTGILVGGDTDAGLYFIIRNTAYHCGYCRVGRYDLLRSFR